MRLNYINILSIIAVVFTLTCMGCTEPEETMSWRPGQGLHIIGATEVPAGATARSYYVDGFTIAETYTWAVNGTEVTPIRNGEFISVTFSTPGDYTITVSNGRLNGELIVSAY
jgi:hypothetical protein